MWYLYVLLCVDGSLYTGIAKNPDKRFQKHLNGKGGHYTRTHKPIKRVYLEKIGSINEALKRERQIKSWGRLKKVRDLELNLD